MTTCNEEQGDSLGNKCFGIGCCRALIPNGVYNVSVQAKSFHNHTYVVDLNPCSIAFVVANDAMPSPKEYLPKNYAYVDNLELPMVYNWSIGTKDCHTAQAAGCQITYARKIVRVLTCRANEATAANVNLGSKGTPTFMVAKRAAAISNFQHLQFPGTIVSQQNSESQSRSLMAPNMTSDFVKMAGFPGTTFAYIPGPGQTVADCPEDFVVFFRYPFAETTIKFPFPPLVHSFFEVLGISPWQLMPSSWRILSVIVELTKD
uniref:Uncharacterized protein n=1 Tax=Chenopodium quinoa TaxID=63459 RepID=A0A803M5T9_CHEQI